MTALQSTPAVLLLSLAAWVAAGSAAAGAQHFARGYDTGALHDVTRTATGAAAVIPSTALISMDAAGNPLWASDFVEEFDGGEPIMYAVAAAPDGSLIVCGFYERLPWIASVAADGSRVQWSQYFEVGFRGWLDAVTVGAQGEIVAIGHLDDAQGSSALLVSCNPDGSSLAAVRYRDPDFPEDMIWSSIEATGPGEFLLGGASIEEPHGDIVALAAKVDVFGNLLSTRRIVHPEHGVIIRGVSERPDGGAYAIAELAPDPENLVLLSLDAFCNIQWSVEYTGVCDAVSVRTTSDGGCLLLANSLTEVFSDCWLLRVDSQGEPLWQREYGLGGSDYSYDLELTDDGGCVAVGATGSFGAGQGWMLRVDDQGSIGGVDYFVSNAQARRLDGESTSHPTTLDTLDLGDESRPVELRAVARELALSVQAATNVGAWEGLGGAITGGDGAPILAGVGTLEPGTFAALHLSGARSSSPVFLFLGTQRIDAPLGDGRLVPLPEFRFSAISTDALGVLELSHPSIAEIPPGVPLYWQAFILDHLSPVGFSASNGVQSVRGGE